MHRGLRSQVPCLSGDAVGLVRVVDVASLVGRESPAELFMPVVRAVVLPSKMSLSVISLTGVAPHANVPHRTTQAIIWAKLGTIPCCIKNLPIAQKSAEWSRRPRLKKARHFSSGGASPGGNPNRGSILMH